MNDAIVPPQRLRRWQWPLPWTIPSAPRNAFIKALPRRSRSTRVPGFPAKSAATKCSVRCECHIGLHVRVLQSGTNLTHLLVSASVRPISAEPVNR
jgi:hypothetical protein